MDQATPTRARALLLDLGGVVLHNARELLADGADRPDALGSYLADPDVVADDDAAWAAMVRHEMTERQYWTERSAGVGRALGHLDWTTRDLMTWLYHDSDVDFLVPEVLDLMADTAAAGLRLVAFTNDMVDFHGREWADAQEWLKPFDAIVDGSETGVLKPDPGAYALAIAATGVPAAETVYLDDMPVNVRGGLDAGLLAIEVLYDDRRAAVDQARELLGLPATEE